MKIPRHRIQSSLAHYIFVNYDLPKVWGAELYNKFIIGNSIIVQKQAHFNQMLTATKISAFAHHIESMKQAFYEFFQIYKEFIGQPQRDYLDKILSFLIDLRNATNHSRKEMIARWGNDVKSDSLFTIKIPVRYMNTNGQSSALYCSKSRDFHEITWKNIAPTKLVKIDSRKIHDIALLSYHILEITKRRKADTLQRFLYRLA